MLRTNRNVVLNEQAPRTSQEGPTENQKGLSEINRPLKIGLEDKKSSVLPYTLYFMKSVTRLESSKVDHTNDVKGPPQSSNVALIRPELVEPPQ